ncbi:uncharacterized protein LOC129952888 [Eupeodes corollae]|uniref:uncharacterized protein LOC129952888 n=1 Tax=Eupeodes corollae TaxID=290404 RepID=UPI0024906DCF|nr:uncharacterized protein LOC129952888 [Eupeodes corollae]
MASGRLKRVESLKFRKMDRLTISKGIQMVKAYYKNDHPATATYRAFKGDYVSHIRPTTQVVGKIVKKFEETELVTNIVNIAALSETVSEDPNVSIPRRYQDWRTASQAQTTSEGS